jgi:hypothetical protein
MIKGCGKILCGKNIYLIHVSSLLATNKKTLLYIKDIYLSAGKMAHTFGEIPGVVLHP